MTVGLADLQSCFFPSERAVAFSLAAVFFSLVLSPAFSPGKKARRMSFVFTAENRSQFNLVRPDAVGFQPGMHANSFGKPAQVWQMNSGT
jgi:hypothetical protein